MRQVWRLRLLLSRLLWRLSVFLISFNSSACLLLNEIGKRISVNTGFLFQHASVLVQRFNAILLHDTAGRSLHGLIIVSICLYFSFLIFKLPWEYTYRGSKNNNAYYNYFLPSPQLPSQLQSVTAVGQYQFIHV